jgi:hypothetical protein
MTMRTPTKWLAAALAGMTLALPLRTWACGCFAPPSPMTPVVQAGERILFAHEGDQVIAYIQIQYEGSAEDFGWLVPLPAVPTVELGSDEVFTKLQAQTNPQYSITTQRNFCDGTVSRSTGGSGGGCGAFGITQGDNSAGVFDMGAASRDMAAFENEALVLKDSIGPYDYAVLKADDKTAMLEWLDANRYYVPDATGEAVAPYIHAGGYFLALKLRAGESAGDVVPVVLRYTSDLPMIPITLTQVGAIPNMGVLVWNLGEARAIPRNYYHVVLNEMPIWEDLLDYPRHVIKAVKEAPGRHAFITEYAGSSNVMNAQLDWVGRFGELGVLRTLDRVQYVQYLGSHGYTFDATLFSILRRYLPKPPQLSNISEAQYYGNYASYASITAPGDPDAGAPPDPFDPDKLTDELAVRIVRPLRAAAQLFVQHPYLTRLYTALSPEDMNVDPVFSENPDLPGVPRQHTATLTIPCRGNAWLTTETGREEQWISSFPPNKTWPGAALIELLREAGPPEIVTNNGAEIESLLGPVDYGTPGTPPAQVVVEERDGCACDVRRGVPSGALGTLVLVAGAIWLARRKRVA